MPNSSDSTGHGADPGGASVNHNVQNLLQQANQLLKQAQGGDAVLIGRLRELLPRFEAVEPEAMAGTITLADVQHAIARQNGKTSWNELLQFLASVDPLHVHAARFLLALREEQATQAKAILDAHPAVATYSVHTAAAVANSAAVRTFVAANPALATQPTAPDGTLPLIYACQGALPDLLHIDAADRVQTVTLLLDAGATANDMLALPHDRSVHIPALYFACVSNNVAVAELLLQRGANPNDGESVYHAAERDHRACLELLLQHGADISSAHSEWGNTPLYFLAGYKSFSPLCASSERGMQWLLEHGANPNVASDATARRDGTPGAAETPLHRIAANGKGVHVAEMLVAHGADIHLKRGDGKTAYALAVRTGNTPVAEYLARLGADTTALDPVDRLLGACADSDAVTAERIVREHPDVVRSLSLEDRQALALAVEAGKTDSVRLLVSLGWSLTDEGPWGGTPLHHAAWHANADMTQLLLELGAPVDVKDSEYGSSPIAWAAHGSAHGHPDKQDDYVAVVELLMKAGATRTASYNKWNEAPEHMASPAVTSALKRGGFVA